MNAPLREPRISFFLMFIIGVVVGVSVYVLCVNYLMEYFPEIAVTAAFLMVFFSAILVLVIVKRRWILTRIFGTHETEITGIIDRVKRSVGAAFQRDYAQAVDEVAWAVRALFARASFYLFLGSAIATCIGLATAFSGLINGAALTRQNELIQAQMDFFQSESEAELRRQLDAILTESIDSRLAAELLMFLGKEFSSSDESASEEAAMNADLLSGRLFLLTSMRDQVHIERAKELLDMLEAIQLKKRLFSDFSGWPLKTHGDRLGCWP